jgi:hypothetical protein
MGARAVISDTNSRKTFRRASAGIGPNVRIYAFAPAVCGTGLFTDGYFITCKIYSQVKACLSLEKQEGYLL